jgi:hypothetical protein
MVERYSHQNGAHIQAALATLERRYQGSRTGPDFVENADRDDNGAGA